MTVLTVNGARREVDAAPDEPLLWVLRDVLGLTGTKFGCGAGFCGACTVHLDGAAARACVTPLSAAEGRAVLTIEGLGGEGARHPVQRAFLEGQVPQCGWCMSGQMMAAAALLASDPSPDPSAVEAGMRANLCRCGGYVRIRRAVARAAELAAEDG